MAVPTQESSDGICGKAMRLRASTSWRQAAAVQEGQNDMTRKANELVRSLVGIMNEEGDIIVAFGSKSKLLRDIVF